MLTEKKSMKYFLFGCIPARLIIAFIPLYIANNLLFYYSIGLFAIGISFLYLYFTNTRLNAFEAGGKTWWAKYRIVHGMLYLLAGMFAAQKKRIASVPLFVDVIMGILLFTKQHSLDTNL
jgi:hypothetical protein|uniref:Uncharacterized protein n=1 Tax=viral metagenome TaxID=1070528 RepID=A0A6C0IN02_9ZZZZ